MKQLFLFIALFMAVLVSAGEKLPKYIILFIGDGMSATEVDLTESWLSYKAQGRMRRKPDPPGLFNR